VTGETVLKTIVLAPPGPFRQELLAFVKSIPELDLVGVAADLPELLLTASQCPQHLAILANGPLFAPVLSTLRQLNQQGLPLVCLVLAENRQQIQQAVTAGADGVLLRGFSTLEFLTALKRITKKAL
jgi:DNA-binding NarL/FixJ family response regulator